MLHSLTRMCIAAVLAMGLTSNAFAVLTLSLDGEDMTKAGPGPVTFDVDVFINWDGNGNNLMSSITLEFDTPAEVALQDGNWDADTVPFRNPFAFGLARVTNDVLGFTNIAGDVAPLVAGDNRLTTLSFVVDAPSGDFPIGINLSEASRGGIFPTDISGEFASVSGGTLSLTAVPEPTSAMLVGFVAAGCIFRRRRATAA